MTQPAAPGAVWAAAIVEALVAVATLFMLQLSGQEPEWSNPQIEDGKLPKNQVKITTVFTGV